MSSRILLAGLLAACTCATTLTFAAKPTKTDDPPTHRKLQSVPFTEVKLSDQFWSPRIKTNREISLPHNFKWCEDTGRFSNFAKAAGLEPGQFEGIYFNDSDVYKVLEGASYSLADHPDAEFEKQVDAVIAKIAAAQLEDGYVNSYYQLVEPDKKWTNFRVRHELYCAGHMFEGAVAHYRATGKRGFLDVAVKFADLIDAKFGPDGVHEVPGHEEIELALVKLYQTTGEKRYLDLAKFFLDIRGNQAERETLYGPYCQDHEPVGQQSEIVGHAVRAMYLFAGVADVASYTGDQEMIGAMDRLWDDVVRHKMYITGGIGARHAGEAFGDRYELPNSSAYCETCAAIGLALWAQRLNMMTGEAEYADIVERTIYNGILSGIGRSGTSFFYVNPLESAGGHHRQPFFSCACCPSNVVRFVPSLPGYVYATGDEGIYVNLYMSGTAVIPYRGGTVTITQKTDYPWSGKVSIEAELDGVEGDVKLLCRRPGWTTDNDTPSYFPIDIKSGGKNAVTFDFPMEVKRMEAHPKVEADRGRVALQRGPLVYCFEGCDNDGRVSNIMLDRDPEFTTEWREDLVGGVMVIHCKDRTGRELTAVPYYAWDHREPGQMAVWVRQDGLDRRPDVDDPAWEGKLYRELDPETLGPPTELSLMEQAEPTASHCNGSDSVFAIADEITPKKSGDDAARLTFWDHRGTAESVQYEWSEPVNVSQSSVFWFDDRDRGQCRVPKSWVLKYRSGDEWLPVEADSTFGVELDQYNSVQFKPVETTALKIELQLQPEFSGGILQWNVE